MLLFQFGKCPPKALHLERQRVMEIPRCRLPGLLLGMHETQISNLLSAIFQHTPSLGLNLVLYGCIATCAHLLFGLPLARAMTKVHVVIGNGPLLEPNIFLHLWSGI